jgi:hypothetical protein
VSVEGLASYRRCVARIQAAWPAFETRLAARLTRGHEPEKVTELIVEDL